MLPGTHMHQKNTDKVQQLLERDTAVVSYSLKLVSEAELPLRMSVSSNYPSFLH